MAEKRSKCANQLTDHANSKSVRVNSFSISAWGYGHVQSPPPLCSSARYFLQSPDVLTTSHGCPVDSKTASLTVGERGVIPIQDFTFLDEMAHFDRERIPERVVHAKGAGMCTRPIKNSCNGLPSLSKS